MTRPTVLDMDLVVVPQAMTPEMIAAAWAAWHSRHGGKIGPGPAFGEAVPAAISASPYPTSWDDVRKYVEGLEARLVAVAGPCSLGVGCEQYGVCYADAHGKPEECGKPSFECEALKDARRIADHDKKLWLAAEARIAELEKRLADAGEVIEPFAAEAACYDPDSGDGDDILWATPAYFKIRHLRAARAYMEGK